MQGGQGMVPTFKELVEISRNAKRHKLQCDKSCKGNTMGENIN